MVGISTILSLGFSTLALAAPAEQLEKRASQTFVVNVPSPKALSDEYELTIFVV